MNVNPASILALLAEQYEQIAALRAENAALREALVSEAPTPPSAA